MTVERNSNGRAAWQVTSVYIVVARTIPSLLQMLPPTRAVSHLIPPWSPLPTPPTPSFDNYNSKSCTTIMLSVNTNILTPCRFNLQTIFRRAIPKPTSLVMPVSCEMTRSSCVMMRGIKLSACVMIPTNSILTTCRTRTSYRITNNFQMSWMLPPLLSLQKLLLWKSPPRNLVLPAITLLTLRKMILPKSTSSGNSSYRISV